MATQMTIKVSKAPKIASESWFKTRWRPAMAWLYMALIVYDFMLMPIFWPVAMFFLKIPFVAWAPLTLQGGALIHITFGAVLGLYAWGRTNEIVKGATPSDDDDDDDASSTTTTAVATSVATTTTTAAVETPKT